MFRQMHTQEASPGADGSKGVLTRTAPSQAPAGLLGEGGRGLGWEFLTRVLKILLVAAAYYVAARFGLQLALIERNVTPFWPPTGIALVAFLVVGPRAWPGVALAAFLVNAPISTSLWAAGTTAVGNTLAPLIASKLLRRVGFRTELDRLRDAIAIVLLAALSAMFISASVGAGTLVLSGAIPAGAERLGSGASHPAWSAASKRNRRSEPVSER